MNTQAFSQTGQMIDLRCEYLPVWFTIICVFFSRNTGFLVWICTL